MKLQRIAKLFLLVLALAISSVAQTVTSVAGNSNEGHLYGTQLSDDEKRDLMEFLKTL